MLHRPNVDSSHLSYRFRSLNRRLRMFQFFMALWAAFCLSMVGGVIYVAAHFITKFW